MRRFHALAMPLVLIVLWLGSCGRTAAQQVTVVNIVPKSNSGEKAQDAEPNLAVNPAKPTQIAATAFTPNPFGGDNAPIYASNDGGSSWILNLIVPSSTGSSIGTFDITLRFAPSGVLYAGIIRDPSFHFQVLRTNNFTSPTPMSIIRDFTGSPDQPYLQATTVQGTDRLYIGWNDLTRFPGATASVDISLDASSAVPTFKTVVVESRTPGGRQDAPSIRPAIHTDGTIYAAFMSWTSSTPIVGDVVVVRDDSWGSGSSPFTALKDTDTKPGKRVVTGRTFPFNAILGQNRVGSSISCAVDPTNSSTVYVAWCDRVSTSDYTLHVRRSTDRGATWSSQDLRTVTDATNPAIVINSVGQVGLSYQALVNANWETHLEISSDAFSSKKDITLAKTPSATPPTTFEPYIGDYTHLLAVDRDFYGIFPANNTPDYANFPNGVKYLRNADFTSHKLLNVDNKTPVDVSIDPFFFRVQLSAPDSGDCPCVCVPQTARPGRLARLFFRQLRRP